MEKAQIFEVEAALATLNEGSWREVLW